MAIESSGDEDVADNDNGSSYCHILPLYIATCFAAYSTPRPRKARGDGRCDLDMSRLLRTVGSLFKSLGQRVEFRGGVLGRLEQGPECQDRRPLKTRDLT